MSDALRVAIIGTGGVAAAVAAGLARAGRPVAYVLSRDADRGTAFASHVGATAGGSDEGRLTSCGLILCAVPDGALDGLGRRLAGGGLSPSTVVLHTSGAHAGSVLGDLAGGVGSLHPLQSFPPGAIDGPVSASRAAGGLLGTHWFHEGAGETEARSIVAALGGVFHALAPGGKALYHAGAAILSNHSVALFDAATRLFEAAGVPADASRAPLHALLAGTAGNLGALGSASALTGPIARGDAATVAAHLTALRDAAPELLPSYVEMARLTLRVARARAAATGAPDAVLLSDVERALDRIVHGARARREQ